MAKFYHSLPSPAKPLRFLVLSDRQGCPSLSPGGILTDERSRFGYGFSLLLAPKHITLPRLMCSRKAWISFRASQTLKGALIRTSSSKADSNRRA